MQLLFAMDNMTLKQYVVFISSTIIVTLVFFTLITAQRVFAQTSPIDSIKQNISSRTDDIKKLEQEILEYKVQLDVVGTQKKTLQGAVQTLDLSRAKLGKDIQLTQKKIERTNSTIDDLSNNITYKERKINQNKLVIANIIHKIDESDSDTMLEVLLSNSSISTFFEDIDNIAKLQISIGDNVKSLERLKEELGQSKTAHLTEKKTLSGFNVQLADQKEIADRERQAQLSLLRTTKNKESNYKKMLSEREERKKKFEREIDDFEAQLRAVINPNNFPTSGTRVLAYPIENVRITQKFGKTIDARRLYASGTHNGIDFAAPMGTPIMAALDGVVIGTGDTDRACRGASYGRWVMIRHSNGLSTMYAHFELIKVNEGQQVSTGDIIGYSGSTGYATGPHLHFGLFVSSATKIVDLPSKACPGAIFHIPVAPANAYLDPQAYL